MALPRAQKETSRRCRFPVDRAQLQCKSMNSELAPASSHAGFTEVAKCRARRRSLSPLEAPTPPPCACCVALACGRLGSCQSGFGLGRCRARDFDHCVCRTFPACNAWDGRVHVAAGVVSRTGCSTVPAATIVASSMCSMHRSNPDRGLCPVEGLGRSLGRPAGSPNRQRRMLPVLSTPPVQCPAPGPPSVAPADSPLLSWLPVEGAGSEPRAAQPVVAGAATAVPRSM